MRVSEVRSDPMEPCESPEYVRLSLAAAMTLGFVQGWFYRNARLGCVNLLLTYSEGCKANCGFCGLAGEKNKEPAARNFIRVPWRTFRTEDVLEAIKTAPEHVGRVCISMITHPRCMDDVLSVCSRVRESTGKAVSLLISPTLLRSDDLKSMRDAGADRIGVAVDCATPEIFQRLRGKPVNGPHRWHKYWEIYEQSLEIFGPGMAGVHLICGLGETERQMVTAISRARSMGGCTHLFSFFPEKGSVLEKHCPPPMGNYRRVQLARWLIDNSTIRVDEMEFDKEERIRDFGLSREALEKIVLTGIPFQTSGCPGPDGKVACNRPYGNEKPGLEIRNFPFPPESSDIERIREELKKYG
jgi:biotin synthase-related radical SAM superfamily protein